MSATQQSRINVWINDAQAKGSVKAQSELVAKLRNEWRNVKAGTTEYENALRHLKQQQAILDEHTGKVKKVKSVWDEILYQGKVFGAMAAGYVGVTTLFSKVGQGIQGAAKLSDVMADVQRTTGMTADETERLKSEFSSWDTRTPTLQLLELAKAGGKLGIAEEDIAGFVKAADQINVALGEDLGTDAITSIGKIVNIFQLRDEFGLEEAMLKVGSAINSAGQASEAAEGYIVDFLNRMGGVAPMMNISATEIIGLGATLDSLGQTSEVSSTALSKLFIKMADDAEVYAGFAQMKTEDFIKLMNEDAMEAFIRVLEGANQSSEGITALTATLGDLGIEGGRATGVFGTLAGNTGRLREQIDLSNKSFEQGTSITQEFTTKNETLGAALDKLMRQINGFVVNSALTQWLTAGIMALGDTSTAAEKAAKAYEQQKIKTQDLERAINPLISRYNELKTQGFLNQEQQEELKGVINKIAELLPTAATEWDEYGNAIDISTGKVQEAISKNKELVQAMGEKEIRELTESIKKLKVESSNLQSQLDKGGMRKTVPDFDPKTNDTYFYSFTDEEMTSARNALIRTNKEMYDQLLRLRDEYQLTLTADQQSFIKGFEAQFGKVKETATKTAEEIAAAQAAEEEKQRLTEEERKKKEEEDKKRREKFKREEEQLLEFIKNKRHEMLVSTMSTNEAEIENIRFKYEQQLALAKNHADQLKEIEILRDKEIADARARQYSEWMNLKAEVQEQIFVAFADEYTLAMKKVDDFFESLIIEAEKYGIATDELYKKWGESSRQVESQFNRAKGVVRDTTEETNDSGEETQEILWGTAEAWTQMGMAAVAAADAEHSAMENLYNAVREQIKALMAQAIAKAIVAHIGEGPLGLITASIAGLGAAALFDTLVPQLAGGGYTPGARMYIAGEAGTEYVAPFRQIHDPVTGPIIQGLDYHRTTGEYPEWMHSMSYGPNYKAFSTAMQGPAFGSGSQTASSYTYNTYNSSMSTPVHRLEELLETLITETRAGRQVVFEDTSIRDLDRRRGTLTKFGGPGR